MGPGEGETIAGDEGEERMRPAGAEATGARTPGELEAGDLLPAGAPGPGREVVTNIEVLADPPLKCMFRGIYLSVLIGACLLAALFGMKLSGRFDTLGQVRPVIVLNAAAAAFQLALLTACLAWFLARSLAAKRAGLTWSRRRWRVLVLFMLQLGCVYLSNLMFLAPNLYILSTECGHLDEAVNVMSALRWSALNGLLALFVIQARSYNLMVDRLGRPRVGQEDALYFDGPWWAHWFIGVYWFIGEVLLTVGALDLTSAGLDESQCRDDSICAHEESLDGMLAGCVLVSVGYLGMFLYFMRQAFMKFAKKSYMHYRWPNIAARFAFRVLGVVMLFGTLSFAFLWFNDQSLCITYATTWLGFLPMQMMLALVMVARTWLAVPVLPSCKKPARAVVAKAHWLEKERLQHSNDGGVESNGEHKPLFCFETAIKLVYWCEFIYEYDSETKVANPPFNLDTALSLYDLTHFACLNAREMDAHAIVAWSQTGTILVCFRGTCSAANVMADLKFWQMPHPTIRGHTWLGRCPMVHRGFMESWVGENFNERVLGKVREILNSPGFDLQKLRIYVTGHSLGGAMAVLAAHDICRDCGVFSQQLSCYTFGSPRVGNHSFAACHDRTVPDTWHIINDLDTVPRLAKFLVLFKRSGQRVIINSCGDMIVSPMFLEFKLSSALIGRRKVVDHLLTAYRRSLTAVSLAQFHRYKELPGGGAAMQELLARGDITRVLGVSQGAANRLVSMSSRVWAFQAEDLWTMVDGCQSRRAADDRSECGAAGSSRSNSALASLKPATLGLLPSMAKQSVGEGQGESSAHVDGDIEAAEAGAVCG